MTVSRCVPLLISLFVAVGCQPNGVSSSVPGANATGVEFVYRFAPCDSEVSGPHAYYKVVLAIVNRGYTGIGVRPSVAKVVVSESGAHDFEDSVFRIDKVLKANEPLVLVLDRIVLANRNVQISTHFSNGSVRRDQFLRSQYEGMATPVTIKNTCPPSAGEPDPLVSFRFVVFNEPSEPKPGMCFSRPVLVMGLPLDYSSTPSVSLPSVRFQNTFSGEASDVTVPVGAQLLPGDTVIAVVDRQIPEPSTAQFELNFSETAHIVLDLASGEMPAREGYAHVKVTIERVVSSEMVNGAIDLNWELEANYNRELIPFRFGATEYELKHNFGNFGTGTAHGGEFVIPRKTEQNKPSISLFIRGDKWFTVGLWAKAPWQSDGAGGMDYYWVRVPVSRLLTSTESAVDPDDGLPKPVLSSSLGWDSATWHRYWFDPQDHSHMMAIFERAWLLTRPINSILPRQP